SQDPRHSNLHTTRNFRLGLTTKRPRAERGYGLAYQKAREAVLAGQPPCHWCGAWPATTADHVPSIAEVGRPHLQLVPACAPCNFGRRPTRKAVSPSRAW